MMNIIYLLKLLSWCFISTGDDGKNLIKKNMDADGLCLAICLNFYDILINMHKGNFDNVILYTTNECSTSTCF